MWEIIYIYKVSSALLCNWFYLRFHRLPITFQTLRLLTSHGPVDHVASFNGRCHLDLPEGTQTTQYESTKKEKIKLNHILGLKVSPFLKHHLQWGLSLAEKSLLWNSANEVLRYHGLFRQFPVSFCIYMTRTRKLMTFQKAKIRKRWSFKNRVWTSHSYTCYTPRFHTIRPLNCHFFKSWPAPNTPRLHQVTTCRNPHDTATGNHPCNPLNFGHYVVVLFVNSRVPVSWIIYDYVCLASKAPAFWTPGRHHPSEPYRWYRYCHGFSCGKIGQKLKFP